MSEQTRHPTEEQMAPETLEALKGSIAKWEGIVAGTEKDLGPDNCALCQIFLMAHPDSCDACPVGMASGSTGCSRTPYEDQWTPLFPDRQSYGGKANTPLRKQAAQAELDFLKSLLPLGATP